eukprot:8352036-Prorocentrum_lima.AAC.1
MGHAPPCEPPVPPPIQYGRPPAKEPPPRPPIAFSKAQPPPKATRAASAPPHVDCGTTTPQ